MPVDRCSAALDDDIRSLREGGKGRLVVERNMVVQRLPSDGAVHRARIDVAVVERLRERPGDCSFPRAGRAVNGDDQAFWHLQSSIFDLSIEFGNLNMAIEID
jgi:hypothetical protein